MRVGADQARVCIAHEYELSRSYWQSRVVRGWRAMLYISHNRVCKNRAQFYEEQMKKIKRLA